MGSKTIDIVKRNISWIIAFKRISGKYEDEEWIFSKRVYEKRKVLDNILNCEKVNIEFTFIDEFSVEKDTISIFGIKAASLDDVDEKLCGNIIAIEDGLYPKLRNKNWTTIVDKGEGIRFQIPNFLFKELLNDEENEMDIKFERIEDKKDLVKITFSNEDGEKVVIEGIYFIDETEENGELRMFVDENSEFYEHCEINKEDSYNKESLVSKICIGLEKIAIGMGIPIITAKEISLKIVNTMMSYYLDTEE